MNITRPIVCFDIEATGTDTSKDRIVSLHAAKWTPDSGFDFGPEQSLSVLCNPGFDMSPDVIEVHGITNESVKNLPPFGTFAASVHDFIADCDLAGFNLLNFDVPMLWEELRRAGISWDVRKHAIVDAGNLFKKKEERTLRAALVFYCGRELVDAHTAEADVMATMEVLLAQRERYTDLRPLSVAELAQASKMDDRVDLAGIITRNKDGVPCFNTKRNRGVPVLSDPGYAQWMLRSDFPTETRLRIQEILEGENTEQELGF